MKKLLLLLPLLASPARALIADMKIGGRHYIGVVDEVLDSTPSTPSPTPTIKPSPTAKPPTPTPTVSTPPSGGDVTTDVAGKQFMDYLGAGVWRSSRLGNSPAVDDQKCYVQLRLPRALKPGEHIRLKGTRKTNVPLDGKLNNKIARAWASETYPNIWDGRGLAEGANEVKSEDGDGRGDYCNDKTRPGLPCNDGYYSYPEALNQEVEEIREYWPSSAKGVGDGRVKITIGGKVVFDRSKFYVGPGMVMFGLQVVIASPKAGACLPPGSYVEVSKLSLEIVP